MTKAQEQAPAAVSLRSVRKDFGSFTALKDVTFDIADNQFFTLLGPSGCGKTTLLRMIAGFEDTSAGTISLYGDEIAALPPDKRPVNTVFQNYALFPHMDVAENIGFGLRMLKCSRAEIEARVDAMIDMVQLREFIHRKPAQLSGGQQQRVALARAMAPRPKVLLLDEPLSALDLKLRQEMRTELKALQQGTGITFIFVTHDQEEALSMSDRIAVMSAGQVQQIGTPAEIYEHPETRFVADFIGETNLIPARVKASDDIGLICEIEGGTELQAYSNHVENAGQAGHISLRPEHLSILPAGEEGMSGQIESVVYLGTDTQYRVRLQGGLEVSVRAQNRVHGAAAHHQGETVTLGIAPGAARFLAD